MMTRAAIVWTRKRDPQARRRSFYVVAGDEQHGRTIVKLAGSAERRAFLAEAAARGTAARSIDRYELQTLTLVYAVPLREAALSGDAFVFMAPTVLRQDPLPVAPTQRRGFFF